MDGWMDSGWRMDWLMRKTTTQPDGGPWDETVDSAEVQKGNYK